MSRIALIAARNLRRNPRRSALTVLAMTLGVAATIFMHAFIEGFFALAENSVTGGRFGSLQVHHRSFLQAEMDPLKFDLPLDEALLARLRSIDGVIGVAPRITFEAMLANGVQSTMVMVTAIDPVAELQACPSRWSNARVRGLDAARPAGAVVGRTLGEAMAAGPGRTLSLTATTRDGMSNALDIDVEALAGTTDPLESKRAVIITLSHAQALLGMEGRVTEYAIGARVGADLDDIAVKVRRQLRPDEQVHTWKELLPEMADGLVFIRALLGFIVGFLFLLMLSGVVNTMWMAVHERTREIGTMMSVGTRRAQILSLFLFEAAVLGALGGLLGGALGYVVVAFFHEVGLPMKPAGSDVGNFIHPVVSLKAVLLVAACAALGSVVAALHPARRASKMTPADALRDV